jgi:hypothetical protein
MLYSVSYRMCIDGSFSLNRALISETSRIRALANISSYSTQQPVSQYISMAFRQRTDRYSVP